MVPERKVKSTVAGDGGGEQEAVRAPRWRGAGFVPLLTTVIPSFLLTSLHIRSSVGRAPVEGLGESMPLEKDGRQWRAGW